MQTPCTSQPSAVFIFCNHIGASRAVLLLGTNLTSDVCLASLSMAQLDSAQKHPPALHPSVLIFHHSVPYLQEAKRAGKNQSLATTAPCTHFASADTQCFTRCRQQKTILFPVTLCLAEFGLPLRLHRLPKYYGRLASASPLTAAAAFTPVC